MENPIDNRISIFNELMVSFYLYLLLALSDANLLNVGRQELGLSLLFCVFFTVLVNLIKALWLLLMECKHKRKLNAVRLNSFLQRLKKKDIN